MDDCLQQQQLGGSISQPAKSLAAVGHDSEVTRKNGSNVEGPGSNVQGGGTVSTTIWKLELSGDWVDYQVIDGVPPPGGVTEHRDDGETQGRRRVGESRGLGGNGQCGAPPHRAVHQEAEENHIREGGLPPRLCNMHGGGMDARDEPDGILVGS